MIHVYFRRRNREAAEALVAQLRAEGHNVAPGDSRFYEGVIGDTQAVFHDGLVPQIQADHDAAEIRCECFMDSSRPSNGAAKVPDLPVLPDGHTIVQNGQWFTLLDPLGNKVGRSQRTEAAAAAQAVAA